MCFMRLVVVKVAEVYRAEMANSPICSHSRAELTLSSPIKCSKVRSPEVWAQQRFC